MRLDLADLRLFVAIAHSGSITGGAAAVNLALASASQRVSGMETSLGVALLERTRRGITLTPPGEALLRHAEALLLRAEQMHGEMRGFATGRRGRIRLMSNTGALLGFLPRVLRQFLAAHPGLDIDLEEHPSAEIVRRVAAGEVELGVIADVVDAGALALHRLEEDRLFLITAATHHLAERSQIDFDDVLGENFVGLLDAALEQHLSEHAGRRGIALNYRLALRSVAAIGRLVQDAIGVAILPESTIPELDGLELRAIPLGDAWARRRLALCLRDIDMLTPQGRLLADHIKNATTLAS